MLPRLSLLGNCSKQTQHRQGGHSRVSLFACFKCTRSVYIGRSQHMQLTTSIPNTIETTQTSNHRTVQVHGATLSADTRMQNIAMYMHNPHAHTHSRTGEGSRDTEGDGDCLLDTPVALPSGPEVSSSSLLTLAAAEKGEGLREDVSASWSRTLRCRLSLRLRGNCWVLWRASRLPATTGEQHRMQTTCRHHSCAYQI